jgi:hypothetical protein
VSDSLLGRLLETVMRINARLDEETQSQLDYLVLSTGQSTSHVVRESVAHYYSLVRRQKRPPSKFLALVGSGNSGHSDLASNYKAYVMAAIDEKHRKSHPRK